MGSNSVSHRARVGGARKLALLGKAVALVALAAGGAPPPALDAAAFLIDAVAREPVRAAATKPREYERAQFVRVLDMFERLERAERFGDSTKCPENYYGIVEMAFSFGLLIAFGVWQLWSVAKTRKRLREEERA